MSDHYDGSHGSSWSFHTDSSAHNKALSYGLHQSVAARWSEKLFLGGSQASIRTEEGLTVNHTHTHTHRWIGCSHGCNEHTKTPLCKMWEWTHVAAADGAGGYETKETWIVELLNVNSLCTDLACVCVCVGLVLGGDQWRARHRPNRNLPWRQRPAAGQDQCVLQWGHWWVHPDTYGVLCLVRWGVRGAPCGETVSLQQRGTDSIV